MQCLQLTQAELAAYLAAGATVVGGPYPDEPTCLDQCGGSSSSDSESSSPESSSSSGVETVAGCSCPNLPKRLYATLTNLVYPPDGCPCVPPAVVELNWSAGTDGEFCGEGWYGSYTCEVPGPATLLAEMCLICSTNGEGVPDSWTLRFRCHGAEESNSVITDFDCDLPGGVFLFDGSDPEHGDFETCCGGGAGSVTAEWTISA